MELEPLLRPAARLLVIAPDDRVLLFCWTHELLRSPSGSVWITPGGGLEADETHEQAALRELHEETGMVLPLGPCVWTRRHVFPWRVAHRPAGTLLCRPSAGYGSDAR